MKLIQKLGILALFAALMASCAEAPKSDDAKTGDAENIKQPVEEAPAATTYNVSTADSKILWVGTKPTGRHNGTINVNEGSFTVDGDKITGGSIVIDMTTLAVEDLADTPDKQADLEGHLKSGDFFEVEAHPTAKFEVAEVMVYEAPAAAEGEEAATAEEGENEYKIENPTHTIRGNLTMKGVEKSIEFPAEVSMEGGKLTAKARFNIDRTNWGIVYMEEGSAQDKFIHNKVNIGFDLVANGGEM